MINAFIIMILLYIGPFIAYFHREIFSSIYSFVRHREIKFFVLFISKFAINIGASAASLVLVAYFIPQVGVTTAMLYKVGISGIIALMGGYYTERFLK